MPSALEKQYRLEAVEAFARRLLVISPDFVILAANRLPAEQVRADVIGKPCYQIFGRRQAPCDNCAVASVLATGHAALTVNAGDSMMRPQIPCYYAYPITRGQEITAVVSLDFDVPLGTGLEERVQQSNAFLRNLINSAVDGVISADRRGNILIFNDAAEELFGYRAEEALSQLNIRDIYPGDLEYQVMAKLRSPEYGGVGKLIGYEVMVVNKRGESLPISLNAAIIYEKDREVATIGFFHDLREERAMKAELEKTQLQLMQANKMAALGKLAAGVAHQLNNPLGGITLYTKLLLEEFDLPQAARDDLHRVLKDAERCRDTVKELLEFARQSKHMMKPCDLNRSLERTLFLLENQSLFQNITIVRALAPGLPMVTADSQQLGHMFMNLILNAAQAMDGRGTLTLTTSLTHEGDRVSLDIADTGPGIPAEALPHIFDPFFTTKEEGKGTGLGLSLVYRIVETHKGSIAAANRPDGGAVFHIEIPLKPDSEASGEQSV